MLRLVNPDDDSPLSGRQSAPTKDNCSPFAQLLLKLNEIGAILESMTSVPRGMEAVVQLKIDPASPRLDALVSDWHAHMNLKGNGAAHIDDSLKGVRAFIASTGIVFPSQITSSEISAWLDECKMAGDSTKYLRNKRGFISAFCTFLISRRIMAAMDNPMEGVPNPRLLKKRHRLVPSEEQAVKFIVTSAKDWRKKWRWLLYLTAASTTLRLGTLLALKWDMVHLDEGLPYLDLPASIIKNGDPAHNWLTKEVADWLRECRAHCGNSGKVFDFDMDAKAFDRDLKKAGIPKRLTQGGPTFSFHSLRHFCITRMKSLQVFDDTERQAQAGHKTPKMTTGVYTDNASTMLGRKIYLMQPLLPDGFTPNWGRGKHKDLDSPPQIADTDSTSKFVKTNAHSLTDNSVSQGSDDSGLGRHVALERSASAGQSRPDPKLPHCFAESVDRTSFGVNGAGGSNPPTPITVKMTPELAGVIRAQMRLIDRLLEELGHGSDCRRNSPPEPKDH